MKVAKMNVQINLSWEIRKIETQKKEERERMEWRRKVRKGKRE